MGVVQGSGSSIVWDSGKVDSDQSVAVEYQGKPLVSGRSYCWKVRTWDETGQAGPWSQGQVFHTGNLRAGSRRDKGQNNRGLKQRCTTPRYPLEQNEVAPLRLVKKGAVRFDREGRQYRNIHADS